MRLLWVTKESRCACLATQLLLNLLTMTRKQILGKSQKYKSPNSKTLAKDSRVKAHFVAKRF